MPELLITRHPVPSADSRRLLCGARIGLFLAALVAGLSAQSQLARIDPFDGALFDHFGYEVAIDGDVLACGAWGHQSGASDDQGAVYVYAWDDTGWTLESQLADPHGSAGDRFGTGLDLSGNLLAVGAPFAKVGNNTHQGLVSLYRRIAGSWQLEAQIAAADGQAGDVFGNQLALDGATLLVGASGQTFGTGAAYLYRRVGGNWVQSAKLTASDGAPGDAFGSWLDLRRNVIMVSAPWHADFVPSQGAVYAYRFNGTSWIEEQKLQPNQGFFSDKFGDSPSLGDDEVLIGGAFETNQFNMDGGAYVFAYDGSSWSEQQHLLPGDPKLFGLFGFSTSLLGDTAVIGAFSADGAQTATGAGYLYRKSGGVWSEAGKLFAADGQPFDSFAHDVALWGPEVVIGAPEVGVVGSTYVFSLSDDAWTDRCHGLAGSWGVPALVGEGPLIPGTNTSLTLHNALENSTAALLLGGQYFGAQFKFGVLGPSSEVVIPGLSTGPKGSLALTAPWPPGFPSGLPFFIQYWINDPVGPAGFSATNTLQGTTP